MGFAHGYVIIGAGDLKSILKEVKTWGCSPSAWLRMPRATVSHLAEMTILFGPRKIEIQFDLPEGSRLQLSRLYFTLRGSALLELMAGAATLTFTLEPLN